MKTFETEKQNMPKGAERYFNQDSSSYFAWYKKVDDKFMVMVIDDSGAHSWDFCPHSEYDRATPIPSDPEFRYEKAEPVTNENKYRYEKLDFKKASEAVALVEDGGSFWVNKTEGLNPFWIEVCNLHGAVSDWEFAHRRIELTERELFIKVMYEKGNESGMELCKDHLGWQYDVGCRFVSSKG